VVLVCFGSAGPVQPMPWVEKAKVGGAAIQLRGDSTEVHLVDAIALRVTVTSPKDVHIANPDFTAPLDGAVLANTALFGPDQTGEFYSRAWEWTIEPLREGELSLPTIRIRSFQAEGDENEVTLDVPNYSVTNSGGPIPKTNELRPM